MRRVLHHQMWYTTKFLVFVALLLGILVPYKKLLDLPSASVFIFISALFIAAFIFMAMLISGAMGFSMGIMPLRRYWYWGTYPVRIYFALCSVSIYCFLIHPWMVFWDTKIFQIDMYVFPMLLAGAFFASSIGICCGATQLRFGTKKLMLYLVILLSILSIGVISYISMKGLQIDLYFTRNQMIITLMALCIPFEILSAFLIQKTAYRG